MKTPIQELIEFAEGLWATTPNPRIYHSSIIGKAKSLLDKDKEDRLGEYILCSAIWYKELPLKKPEIFKNRGFGPYNVDKGIVICGWRHPNCIYSMVSLTGKRSVPEESGEFIHGFLTNKNRFVDRKEGGAIAYNSGQTEKFKTYLFSEDLW